MSPPPRTAKRETAHRGVEPRHPRRGGAPAVGFHRAFLECFKGDPPAPFRGVAQVKWGHAQPLRQNRGLGRIKAHLNPLRPSSYAARSLVWVSMRSASKISVVCANPRGQRGFDDDLPASLASGLRVLLKVAGAAGDWVSACCGARHASAHTLPQRSLARRQEPDHAPPGIELGALHALAVVKVPLPPAPPCQPDVGNWCP